jgi:hypothetical protein
VCLDEQVSVSVPFIYLIACHLFLLWEYGLQSVTILPAGQSDGNEYSRQTGKIFLFPVRQLSDDPKVKDYAGNLQFHDKSKSGKKIKNCCRKLL